jgi:aminoglycoside phosphotransferase (APT) family kinase protein
VVKPELSVLHLIQQASRLLGHEVTAWQEAAAGADHLVVFARTDAGREVVLKAGLEANVDAFVLRRLAGRDVPTPRLLAEAPIDGGVEPYWLAVMTRAEGTLLAEVPEAGRYLPGLMSAVHELHRVTAARGAGPVLEVERGAGRTWKDYLLGILTGAHPEFRWAEEAESPWVDATALGQSLDAMVLGIEALPDPPVLTLLHGDLNPYNVFVQDGQISGLIDWSYTRYGDPLFDFARVRMNPLVRSNPAATTAYFELLDLNREERAREQTYYLFNLLEYVNWYVQDHRPDGVRDHLTLLGKAALAAR